MLSFEKGLKGKACDLKCQDDTNYEQVTSALLCLCLESSFIVSKFVFANGSSAFSKACLSRELEANVVTAFAVSHHVPGELAISQHDIPEIQGSCRG